MQRLLFATLVVAVVVIALFVPTVTAQRRATPISTPLTITAVSPLQNNGWTVRLENGEVLFVEVRVLDTGGRGPRPGRIADFTDQWQFAGQYGGHATFRQNGLTYYAYRP